MFESVKVGDCFDFGLNVNDTVLISQSRPPAGCLQYLTGLTGRLETFNFQQTTVANQMHLASQQ